MKSASRYFASLAGALSLLSGCGQNGGEASNGKSSTETVNNGGELKTSLQCWALTSDAYFKHLALADQSGNLPKPSEAVYTGWAKQLAILSFDEGMGFKAFQSMKDKAKREVRGTSLTVEPEHAAAVQTCMDTVPPLSNRPDPSWPSGS